MSRSRHQPTLGILGHAFNAYSRRNQVPSMYDPLRPSDRRRLQSAADSSEDDVPTPEDIDPSLFDRFDCDHDPDSGGAPLADDDQPYPDAP